MNRITRKRSKRTVFFRQRKIAIVFASIGKNRYDVSERWPRVKERLQKVIADAGVTSRRKAEQLIVNGRVRLNGELVTRLGTKVDPDADHIEVDGRLIEIEKKRTYLFYKPRQVITSVSDPQGRKVVTDFFEHIPARLYPVGRLDYDTEGLLLMTNDGKLAHYMTHPSFEIEKSYLALVEGHPDKDALHRLAQGIELADGLTAPADVALVRTLEKAAWIRITLHEGRNRQVRRMCEAIRHPVKKLRRERMAFLRLGQLKPGQFRPLTPEEQHQLRNLIERAYHR